MYIDTHTHLNLKAFKDDWKEVVAASKKAGVGKILVVGTELESSEKAVKMAEKNEGLFAVVGFHPHHCKGLDVLGEMIEELEKLTESKKVVAIGECGLDYHVYRNTKYENTKITEEQKRLQKQVFGKQIQLAKKLDLPLVIHNREAQKDILDVIDHFCKNDGEYPKGVFHCMSGSVKFLRQVLDKGFFVGIDGNVTYSGEVEALAREVPLERLLIETDSPWLTPAPYRGLRNSPVNVKIVADSIARIKNVNVERVRASTAKNAEALFNL